METQISMLESLLESAKQYNNTSLELLKLKSVSKTADMTSALIVYLIIAVILSLFAISLSVALAFWLGDLLGNIYQGFLAVASFYGLQGGILFLTRKLFMASLRNGVINLMLN
jgi:hypothetical protein